MDDDAEYTVAARNVAGEVRSTAEVIVEPYAGACSNHSLHVNAHVHLYSAAITPYYFEGEKTSSWRFAEMEREGGGGERARDRERAGDRERVGREREKILIC